MRSPAACWALPLLAVAIVSCGARSAPQEDASPASSQQPAEVAGNGSPPNRLIHESSPYLLLHARNPVDWYPWGEEAIEKARREGKPIFLSVGYSTCYWCHVMEREVFSSGPIAQLMNQWFVSIKVDREERPEVDEIYMTATQLLTRGGGWPNSLFLTPELKPFYAGTYFPPEDGFGRPGFPSVLRELHRAWQERRTEVTAVADRVAAAMGEAIAERREPARELPGPAVARRSVADLESRYDAANGGFGGPPKFPSPSNLFLLWDEAERGDSKAREMVVQTLLKMGRGAIYDQLDGGFHRYTLDGQWRIPHFEKMLYDNAHLAELLAVTSKATGDPELERLVRGTLDFVLRDMTLSEGAFKSAIDAETDSEEGAFYTWTEGELRQVLGAEGYSLLAPTFGFDGQPNFEEKKYTLFLAQPLGERAKALGLTRQQLLDRLRPHLEKLRKARHARKFPLVDDKVLADWNGMMIAAMARAGHLLGEPRYVRAASQAAGFVLASLRTQDGKLLHAWRGGTAKIPAFLDDYAFLIHGLLALGEATGEPRWLCEAERLAEEAETRLRDLRGGYFLSEAKTNLLFQPKTVTDGAIPSGNSVMALDLLILAERTGKEVYRSRAEQALRAFAADLERFPAALPSLAQAVFRLPGGRAEPGTARPASEAVVAAGTDAIEAQARDVVAATARVTRPADRSGWAAFEVQLTLRQGWHVNANPASLEFLIPTEVQGDVRNVTYPRGEAFKSQFAEEILNVYSGRVVIGGEARNRRGSILLRYQACDDQRCLPPVTRTVEIEGAKPAGGN